MDLHGDLSASVEDGAVTFTYAVENEADEPAEVTFRSGQAFDVVVSSAGEEVWRWSDGQMFTMAMRTATIDPGDVERFEAEWEPPEPGTYEAVARLEARELRAEARTVVEL